LFRSDSEDRGIANITILQRNTTVTGFAGIGLSFGMSGSMPGRTRS